MTARTLIVWCLLAPLPLAAQTKEPIGDVPDGTRSTAVHLLKLYDEFDHVIRPDDKPIMPYSPKNTCKPCHSYDTIRRGWHFNWADSGVAAGREGEPWVFVDRAAAIQVPLSTRGWKGAYHPRAFGLRTFQFVTTFGRHLPGGGAAENDSLQDPEDYMRWQVSGNLEVNCQNCHNGDPGQSPAEYGVQVLRQNFRWAPTASSGFAMVQGSAGEMPDNYDLYSAVPPERSGSLPPTVTYNASRFDAAARVLFAVPRRMPASQCYFCHSSKVIEPQRRERWEGEEDVHIAAGMTCVDCHRNGVDHRITRGYEGENAPEARSSSVTCRGCHMGDERSDLPGEGRRRAPRPAHVGIPPVHFEKLSCTVCHSGPWPSATTATVKTSRAHALGIPKADKADDALPHILTPVFIRNTAGVYAPSNILWPSFWAFENDGMFEPIFPSVVKPLIATIYQKDTTRTIGRWPVLRNGDILATLTALKDSARGTPVYVNAGRVYSVAPNGSLESREDPAAQAYAWPIAHDVRPKGQSLGVRGCDDCHATDAPLYFGSVRAASPYHVPADSLVRMTEFQGQSPVLPWLFSFSFLFRPWLKVVLIVSLAFTAAILLYYLLRGLGTLIRLMNAEE